MVIHHSKLLSTDLCLEVLLILMSYVKNLRLNFSNEQYFHVALLYFAKWINLK